MEKNSKIPWPNFFVVGAARAGTDSLYNYLKGIPGVYMPPEKSAGYFSSSDSYKFLNKERYLALYKDVKEESAIGEVNPDYLLDPRSAKLIHDTIPNAKIIISLRNPVNSTYSLYMHKHKHEQVTLPFHIAITNYLNSSETNKIKQEIHSVIQTGFYSKLIQRYLEEFPKDKIKIIVFEESIKNIEKSIRDILKFLKINDQILLPSNLNTVYNQNVKPLGYMGKKVVNNPLIKKTSKLVLPGKTAIKFLRLISNKRGKTQLLQEDYQILESIYEKDVKKLENMLGRKLPW